MMEWRTKMNKNIAFIGFMGSGKSTISKSLSKKLNMTMVDTDEYIVEKNNQSISDMFDSHGEEYFRDKETEAIKEISNSNGIIISCGGGAVLRDENVECIIRNIMHNMGFIETKSVIWLKSVNGIRAIEINIIA